jgi:hypothetical protein
MESVGDFYVDAAGIAILLYVRLMSTNNVLQNSYIFDREKTIAYTNTGTRNKSLKKKRR